MRAALIATLIVALLSGCSDSSDTPPESVAAISGNALAPLQETPAFRNLGKRGESKL
jgi:hypothetical protein